jgi:hypothetical protein
MTAQEIYSELLLRSGNYVEDFKTDFDIDLNSLKKYPNLPFIHLARKSGTALIFLFPADFYPSNEDQVKYLFGTANRDQILAGQTETLEHYLKIDASHVNYFDGKKLVKIKQDKALMLMEQNRNRVKAVWNEEQKTVTT